MALSIAQLAESIGLEIDDVEIHYDEDASGLLVRTRYRLFARGQRFQFTLRPIPFEWSDVSSRELDEWLEAELLAELRNIKRLLEPNPHMKRWGRREKCGTWRRQTRDRSFVKLSRDLDNQLWLTRRPWFHIPAAR